MTADDESRALCNWSWKFCPTFVFEKLLKNPKTKHWCSPLDTFAGSLDLWNWERIRRKPNLRLSAYNDKRATTILINENNTKLRPRNKIFVQILHPPCYLSFLASVSRVRSNSQDKHLSAKGSACRQSWTERWRLSLGQLPNRLCRIGIVKLSGNCSSCAHKTLDSVQWTPKFWVWTGQFCF